MVHRHRRLGEQHSCVRSGWKDRQWERKICDRKFDENNNVVKVGKKNERRNPLKYRYLLSSHTASHTRRYSPLSELRPVMFHMCLPAFIQNTVVKCSKPSTVTQKLFSVEQHTPSDMQCDQIMKKNVPRDGADRKLPQSRSITNWSGGPMSFYFLRVL